MCAAPTSAARGRLRARGPRPGASPLEEARARVLGLIKVCARAGTLPRGLSLSLSPPPLSLSLSLSLSPPLSPLLSREVPGWSLNGITGALKAA
jgi:hypothetical protein